MLRSSIERILLDEAAVVYILKTANDLSEAEIQALSESRIEFIKNAVKGKIKTEHDPMAAHTESDAIVDHIASVDPTPKKIYTQWMVKQYNSGAFKQEDAYRLGDSLSTFDQHKNKLEKKDINQYKTVDELKTAVAPHVGTVVMSNKEKKQQIRHEGLPLIYSDDHIDIHHVKTKEASQSMYGGGSNMGKTDWCTAANSENCMFDRYNEMGPMFTIHRKSDGAMFQFHPNTNQFMNAKDEPISSEEFESIRPSFHKALDQHEDKFLADKL